MLPVGEAVVIPTMNPRIPHLIAAPTMNRPMDVSRTQNAYLAMRAVLRRLVDFNSHAATRSEKPIHRVLIPGLATGVGQMAPDESARQMRRATDEELANQPVCLFGVGRKGHQV